MKAIRINHLFNKKNIIRAIHFVIVAVLMACLGLLYYYAVEDVFSDNLYIVSLLLFCEAAVLLINRGRCPLEHVHKKVGDDKVFFELFVPTKIVPYTAPFFICAMGVGFLFLYF